jgi:uncharacterized membrane protein
MTLPNISLGLALFAVALMAGLFYAYSYSVNPGLGKIGNVEYLRAMQSINKAILNPGFFSAFFGALILLPLAAYFNYYPQSLRFKLLLAASLIYAVGLFGVTVFGNVPLNEMLDKFDITKASATEIADMRREFEQSWNRYHTIRTLAVIVSLLFTIVAAVYTEETAD